MSSRKEPTDLSKAFGRAVRKLREKAGFTQEGFAHQVGIDRAYFGLTERGGHTPTIATVWKIAQGLGKRPRDVMAATELEMTRFDKLKSAEAKKGSSGKTDKNSPTDGQPGKVGKLGKGGGKD